MTPQRTPAGGKTLFPIEFLHIALLALSGVLLYFGFAPKASRWRFSLGILGAGIAIGVWWSVSSNFVPIEPRDFFRLGFVEIMNGANSGLCLVTICIGVALALILRGNRRLAAVGVGVVLPVVIGQVFFGTVSERQRVNDAHRLDVVQADLDQSRALWEAHRPARYRFTVQQTFFCPPNQCPEPQTVIVAPGYAPSWTVEKLFAEIQTGIGRNYDMVYATYDPELGYPLRIHTNHDMFSEGNVFFTITDFQILQ